MDPNRPRHLQSNRVHQAPAAPCRSFTPPATLLDVSRTGKRLRWPLSFRGVRSTVFGKVMMRRTFVADQQSRESSLARHQLPASPSVWRTIVAEMFSKRELLAICWIHNCSPHSRFDASPFNRAQAADVDMPALWDPVDLRIHRMRIGERQLAEVPRLTAIIIWKCKPSLSFFRLSLIRG